MNYGNIRNAVDVAFKIVLLIFVAYFLYIITKYEKQIRENSDIGRYQFDHEDQYILDTKTGEVRKFDRP